MNTPSTRPRVLKPESEVRGLLGMLAEVPPLHSMEPAEARAMFVAAAPLLYPDFPPIDERRMAIAGVPARIYRPLGSDPAVPLPTMLFFHGGGWVMGDLDGYAPICGTLANDLGICVIAPDYALAPEHRFPAAVVQAIAISDALFAGDVPGVDCDRMVIAGDSAGGNLAAVVTLHRRDAGQRNFAFQWLIYPVTDLRLEAASYSECGSDYMLSYEDMRWFRSHYLREGQELLDWRVSPLLADDHSDLPPAYVITCGLDPLQDDGRHYADALERAGVDVQRRHYARQIHGFLFMGKALSGVAPALVEAASVLRAAFGSLRTDRP